MPSSYKVKSIVSLYHRDIGENEPRAALLPPEQGESLAPYFSLSSLHTRHWLFFFLLNINIITIRNIFTIVHKNVRLKEGNQVVKICMFISNSVKLLFWKRETHDYKPVSCFHCLLFKTLVIGTDLECSQHLFFIDIRWFREVAPGTRSWESLCIYASRNDNSLVNTITIRRGTPKTGLKKNNNNNRMGERT